jgi:hypothetical protein
VKTGNSQLDVNSLQQETNGLQADFDTLRELLRQVEGERDDLRIQRDRFLNIIEEQAGNIKQLTYKPVVENVSRITVVRPIFGMALVLAMFIAVLWYIRVKS